MKLFVLWCFSLCISAFGINTKSYKQEHAMNVLGFPLPIAGESLAFVCQAGNFRLNRNNTYRFWLPLKPFVQNLRKKVAPFRHDWVITGIPRLRRVKLDAIMETDGRYRFESKPMELSTYALFGKKYYMLPDSKKKKTMVFWGYKSGRNIVLTETVGFIVSNSTYPPIIVQPYRLKDATAADPVDLKISEPYKIQMPMDKKLEE